MENGKFIVNPQFEWTGGGWITTSEDLARWAKALFESRAFAPALLPQMLDGVPAKVGRDAKYGLGAMIRPTASGLTYGHSGFFPGYITEMMYFPDRKLALAVQVNTSVPQNLSAPLSRLLPELAAEIFGSAAPKSNSVLLLPQTKAERPAMRASSSWNYPE